MLPLMLGVVPPNTKEHDMITAIYNTYYSTMYYTAISVLRDHSLAEDAVAESMIKIIKNLHKIGEIDCYQTRAFIVIIVRNTALDILRKRTSRKEDELSDFTIQAAELTPLEALTVKDAISSIVLCIRRLPPGLSDVLYLSAVLEHSNEEIAQLLGISKDVVKVRLSRAKKRVREMLQEEGLRE